MACAAVARAKAKAAKTNGTLLFAPNAFNTGAQINKATYNMLRDWKAGDEVASDGFSLAIPEGAKELKLGDAPDFDELPALFAKKGAQWLAYFARTSQNDPV